jgi:hypothetical protein
MSGVRREASVRPILSGATIEWFPLFGVLWQVVHVLGKEVGKGGLNGLPTAPLSPATPAMVIDLSLNRRSPRAIAASAWFLELSQAP